MRILVVGDLIIDHNRYCRAERLCPEAPAPVLIEQEVTHTQGGAGLVAAQLRALVGGDNVLFEFGSVSRKERVFADGHLICRVDYDSLPMDDEEKILAAIFPSFEEKVLQTIEQHKPGIVIISDYNKGSFTCSSADNILDMAERSGATTLVDARVWQWYCRPFAIFPNQHELLDVYHSAKNVIQKLGPQGCSVNGQIVPMEEKHAVADTTGAGDCFLAAFAARLSTLLEAAQNIDQKHINMEHILISCAKFANKVAGRSVEFLGTKVITEEFVP